MTIGIDASKVAKKIKTGTETYSTELIRALSLVDKKNNYILYSPEPINEKLPNLGKNFLFKVLPFGKGWTQIRLSMEMIKNPPDILFSPAHTLPMRNPRKTICTVHDLGFKHYPELYSQKELMYQSWALNHAIKNATHIISVSNFTKNDLISQFNLDPNRITAIWEGFDNTIFRSLPKKTAKFPYLLFIGRLEDKKNVTGMIRAYGLLRKEKKITHKFILGGNPGYGYEKIINAIGSLPKDIAADVILTGYVNQEKYLELLKNADILFFCTFFEGFGLPLLEAMGAGVPVVASNRTSIPEIASKAALLVNPEDPLEMAMALSKLINSSSLKTSLISKGLARASLFSWKKTAEETLALFEKIYAQ